MNSKKKITKIDNVLNSGHTEKTRSVRFHPKAIDFIRIQSVEIRQKLGEAIRDLQKGVMLGMPLSRPMPIVAAGVSELRVSDAANAVRVFYLAKLADEIVVFHGFDKDTQETPRHEIELGRKRMQEVLRDEK